MGTQEEDGIVFVARLFCGVVETGLVVEELKPSGGERIVVVGGANTDYIGVPFGELLDRDSNPGTVRVSPGGVARNIAENLARLGMDVQLITGFGNDAESKALLERTRAAGVGIENAYLADDLPGARYIAVNDSSRDLAVAVSDTRVLQRVTPELLQHPARERLLSTANLVVADANLSEETLAWLTRSVRAPLVIDPVSLVKARRLRPLLARIAAIKPNGHEAGELLGIPAVANLEAAEEAAKRLVAEGVESVFLTPGPAGVAWADRRRSGRIPSPGFDPVNASGAGDAFVAGVVYAMLAGANTENQAKFGSALSLMALESDDTVSDQVTAEAANMKYRELYG